ERGSRLLVSRSTTTSSAVAILVANARRASWSRTITGCVGSGGSDGDDAGARSRASVCDRKIASSAADTLPDIASMSPCAHGTMEREAEALISTVFVVSSFLGERFPIVLLVSVGGRRPVGTD